jgi:hypothetical protein
LNNLAGNTEMRGTKQALRGKLDAWMKDTADPRAVNPHDDRWDKYEYFGGK